LLPISSNHFIDSLLFDKKTMIEMRACVLICVFVVSGVLISLLNKLMNSVYYQR